MRRKVFKGQLMDRYRHFKGQMSLKVDLLGFKPDKVDLLGLYPLFSIVFSVIIPFISLIVGKYVFDYCFNAI